jgi:hypothetical protein
MIAKTELAQLINLPPGRDFTLEIPPDSQLIFEPINEPIDRMEQVALVRNPDLRELSYQSRISVNEVHRSILSLLPGISFNYGPQYDSNSFLVNSWWGEGAVRVTWNLMSLLTGAPGVHRARDSVKLAEAQRQALAMAVLTKLHLAYQQYLDAGKEYSRAQALAEVNERLYTQLSGRAAAEALNELEPIVAGVALAGSLVRRYESYSNLQAALGRLYDTVGIDIDPADLVRLDAAALGRKTEEIMATWERGDGTGGPVAPPPVAEPAPAAEKPGFFDRLFGKATN